MISIKYMLKNRINKENFSIKNNVVDTICSIQEQVFKNEGKIEIKKYIKEAAKINILDIKRARKEYKIKSKTIQNLLDRMVKFELSNLENIKNV